MNDGEILICRCEEVSKADVLHAIDSGCHTVSSIKKATRAGMGTCQGKTCGRLIMQILLEKGLQTHETIKPDKARFPLLPCGIDSFGEDS